MMIDDSKLGVGLSRQISNVRLDLIIRDFLSLFSLLVA